MRISIQLLLISPLYPSSLCWKFDFCFIKIAVKTLLKHYTVSAPMRTPRLYLPACRRVITREGGCKNKLTSSPKCLILQNGIRRSSWRRSFLLQIVALSSAGVYLLEWERGLRKGGGGGGVVKANRYLSVRSASRLERCFGAAYVVQVIGG